MANWQIECKDILTWCKEYDGPKFHAMLCDSPYHLTTITKRFGKEDAAPAQYGRDGAFQRVSKGFMGSTWDGETNGVGIAFDPATWAALSEHLLPGAFIMAFASTRGWHRMACAMEDAGLIMQPSIFVNGTLEEVPMMFGWLNAQSFPKASRIDTKIDQAAGADRETVAYNPNHREGGGNSWPQERQPHTGDGNITAPATDLARAWEGHRYGGQILKNCLEPIIVCQKPWGKNKRLDCIVETGAGALFIDGGRVSGVTRDPRKADGSLGGHSFHGYEFDGRPKEWDKTQGRWPPNFVLLHSSPHICADCDGDGCDECNDTGLVGGCQRAGTKRVKGVSGGGGSTQYGSQNRSNENTIDYPDVITYADADGLETVPAYQCSENCAARRIGEQSGQLKSGARQGPNPNAIHALADAYDGGWKQTGGPCDASSGTAARFFPQFDWAAEVAERLANSDQVRYCAKSSRSEREAGLDALPVQECGSLDGGDDSRIGKVRSDGAIQHTTGKPKARNIHSTIKPINLATWLSKLLLPPPEYAPRRILIPFSGVSSEGIGALFAGFDEIVMIEQDAEYCTIGEARLKFWSQFNSYEEAMEATQNIQRSHRKQDAQAQSGQLKLAL